MLTKDHLNRASLKIRELMMKYHAPFRLGMGVAQSVSNMAKDKNPLALLEGGFRVMDSLFGLDSSLASRYFSSGNGWKILASNTYMTLYERILSAFPSKPVPIAGAYNGEIFAHTTGEIALLRHDLYDWYSGIYYRGNLKKEEVQRQLLKDLFATLGSDFVSCGKKDEKLNLVAEEPYYIEGASKKYLPQFQKSLELGINRSIILYGVPGCGKTVLSHALCKDLGLRTLKLRSDIVAMDIRFLKELIDVAEIKAIIIDDFDQIPHSNQLLEIIAVLNQNTKLMFGIVNSLKEFHPALLRPGRFDELIKIDALEEDTVKSIVGDIYDEHGTEIRNWPVAYLNELMKRLALLGGAKEALGDVVKELGSRVAKQREELSK
jgi:hypothetical protein